MNFEINLGTGTFGNRIKANRFEEHLSQIAFGTQLGGDYP